MIDDNFYRPWWLVSREFRQFLRFNNFSLPRKKKSFAAIVKNILKLSAELRPRQKLNNTPASQPNRQMSRESEQKMK